MQGDVRNIRSNLNMHAPSTFPLKADAQKILAVDYLSFDTEYF